MTYNFNNIVGFSEEREELKRLCNIFNERETFIKKGCRLPKGVIFYGAPGNGKTLFAKVMASVCDLKVIKIDLGNVVDSKSICKWIKNAFARARKNKGSTMIFFDEIDKVLPDESNEYNSSISKTILAQLLTQIDGMDSTDNIIFVATCNNYYNLPRSLVRSGRIDKKLKLDNPNYDSRFRLIKHYLSKSNCNFELPTSELAKLTVGFSCAEMASFVNECVLHSDEQGFINKNDVYDCVLEIKNEDIPRKTGSASDELFACRNIGSFIVGKNFKDDKYVLNLEQDTVCNEFFNNVMSDYDEDYSEDYSDDEDDEEYEDNEDIYDKCENINNDYLNYYGREDLLNTICVLFGGYAAEEIIFNKVYDNVGHHLSIIDEIIMTMFYNGLFGLDCYYNSSRAKDMYYSNDYIEKLNLISERIRQSCYENAKKIVMENETLIKQMIPILVEKRNIDNIVGDKIIEDLGGMKKIVFLSYL